MRRGVPPKQFFHCDTRQEFCFVWRTIFKAERGVEIAKRRLIEKPGMCLRRAFQLLDYSSRGFLTASDFRDLLSNSGFYATDRELAGLMYRLDQDQDSKVTL